MDWLNRQGDRTTAFNLAAVIGIVVTFLVFNVQEALGGRWELGPSPDMGTEEIRKMIGLFAIVQGFEASRYIGVRFGAEQRVRTMHLAQVVASVVFVVLAVALPLVAVEATAYAQTLEERIAAVRQQRARAQQARELRPSVKILQALYYSPVSVEFREVRARDAFDFLKTMLDVNMVVRWADDSVGHGIDPETLITLELKDLALTQSQAVPGKVPKRTGRGGLQLRDAPDAIPAVQRIDGASIQRGRGKRCKGRQRPRQRARTARLTPRPFVQCIPTAAYIRLRFAMARFARANFKRQAAQE